MKTIKIFTLFAACTFALLSCEPSVEPEGPADDTNTPSAEEPGKDPVTPEEDTVILGPDITTEVFYNKDSLMLSLIKGDDVAGYNGQLADDAANDIVGTDKKIYWEANTFNESVNIVYTEEGVTVSNAGENLTYTTEGNYLSIELLADVELVVSGECSDGQLNISGNKNLKLTFDGIDLTCAQGPAVYNLNDGCTFIHLKEGTVNSFKDSKESEADGHEFCFHNKGNMVFSGTGVFMLEGRKKNGLRARSAATIRPGVTFIIPNTVERAFYVSGKIQINGGLFYIDTSSNQNSSSECIKGGSVILNGGKLVLYSWDDCINGSSEITINDGYLWAYSVCGDGLDSNGNMYLNGGTSISFGLGADCTEKGYDYNNDESGYYFVITGGLHLGLGGDSVLPSLKKSTQRSFMFQKKINYDKGVKLAVKNDHGTDLFNFVVDFKMAKPGSLLFTSNKIYEMNHYTLYVDDVPVSEITSKNVAGKGTTIKNDDKQ